MQEARGTGQKAKVNHASRITHVASRINTNISVRYEDKVKPALLKEAAQAALDQQRVRGKVEITIAITGDAQLRALNLAFRKINKPTDVLSFGLEPAADAEPSEERHYLGDVIISYPMARAQAKAGGHPIEAELELLVVHGVLHLLGHDHAKPKEKAKMWKAQSRVLRKIGAAITEPTD
ncbi:MAG TPA: rRNA maturation RNase YbeY [Anaerolineae bacterium]|jgi:probable rRNA maturation factor|nr:rRNA maturation RNase YbeY [Anaerolineae bacterium]